VNVSTTRHLPAKQVFGGSTQFLAAWLTRLTGNPLVPAGYMIGGVAVGPFALARLPETAPAKTGRTDSWGANSRCRFVRVDRR